MIPKGNRRGGGQDLATHLYNAYNNDEKPELFDIRASSRGICTAPSPKRAPSPAPPAARNTSTI
jgi:hypothetical protein